RLRFLWSPSELLLSKLLSSKLSFSNCRAGRIDYKMRLALLLLSALLFVTVFCELADARQGKSRSMRSYYKRMRSSMVKLKGLSYSRTRRAAAMRGRKARVRWARRLKARRVRRAAIRYRVTRVSRRIRRTSSVVRRSRVTSRARVRRVARRSSYSRCKLAATRFVSCTRRLYTRCPAGYKRRGNMCFRVYCPKPYVRRGAKCVRYRRVVARRMACPRGFTRYGSRCVQRLGLACSAGYRVYKGRCHLVRCPAGFTKIGNSCRKSCRKGFTLKGFTCVRIRTRCPKNYYRVGARCVRYRSGRARCRSGYKRKGSKCIRILKSCPRNYKRRGKRVSLPVLVDGFQGEQETVAFVVSLWYPGALIQCTMNSGSCAKGFRKIRRYKRGYSCVRIACPKNYVKRGSACVYRYKKRRRCPSGYTRMGSTCRRIRCPGGYVRRGSRCVFVRCPSGYRRAGRMCVRTRFVKTCPSGWVRHGKLCRRLICPSGYKKVGQYCITKCPSGYAKRYVRQKVYTGRKVSGSVRKCSCIGAKTGKKPSKKNAIDMAFVVDVTGSMGSVIRAIKAKIREVINANAKSRIYVTVRRCVRRSAARTGGSSSSGSRGRRRCPPGFRTVRSGRRGSVRCVRRSSKRCGKYFRRYGRKCIRVRCPRSMKSRRIRSRVRVGKRVAGYTKKCSCIGAKTGKKPSKKNAIDMAFVVDVTGSMGSVIRAIKAKIREVINANAKSRIVNKFVLVPYGDPKVGPVTATRARSRSSVNSLIRAVNAMRASGGGDCAEFGFSGIYEALTRVKKNSIVYVFTDASPSARDRRRVKGRCVRRGAARTGGSSSSGSRGRRRCPPGFQTVRSGRRRRVRCVRRSSIRCPRSMKSRRIRSRVRVGKRVAGYTKKCSCIGAKTGKKPSKKNAIDMAFVVDVTGSMGSVIRAIKAKIREVINANAKSRIVNKFVLVPYGDPKVGPESNVRSLARRKNAQLNFLITGNLCGRRNSYRGLSRSTRGAWIKMSRTRASRVMSFVSRALKHGASTLRGLNRDGLSTFVSRREKCRCRRVPRFTAKYSYVNSVKCVKRSTSKCRRGYRRVKGRCVRYSKRCRRGYKRIGGKCKKAVSVGVSCGTFRCTRGMSCLKKYRYDARVRSSARAAYSARLVRATRWFNARRAAEARRHKLFLRNMKPRLSAKRVSRFCEHKTGTVSCPRGTTIDIVSGFYGRVSNKYCTRGPRRTTSCSARTASSRIRSSCQNRQSCRLSASNSVFGDPCVGTLKYVEIRYRCKATRATTGARKAEKARYAAALKKLSRSYNMMKAKLNASLKRLQSRVSRCAFVAPKKTGCKAVRCGRGKKCVMRRRRFAGRMAYKPACVRVPPSALCARIRCGRGRRCVIRTKRRRIGRRVRVFKSAKCQPRKNLCSTMKCRSGSRCRVVYQTKTVRRRVRRRQKRCSCNRAVKSKAAKSAARGSAVDMAFVIDTTGSMGRVIRSIQSNIIKIVKANRGTVSRFVVAPFNDPKVGPLTVSTKAGSIVSAVRRLRARGGGDCPELAMRGILAAARKVKRGSVIYVFTDASAKDYRLQKKVRRVIDNKNLQMVFIVTGRLCGRNYHKEYQALSRGNGRVITLNSRKVNKVLSFIRRAVALGSSRLRRLNLSDLGSYIRKCKCRSVTRVITRTYKKYRRVARCTKRAPGDCKSRKCSKGFKCVAIKTRSIPSRTVTRCVRSSNLCNNIKCRKGYACKVRKFGRMYTRRGRRYRLVRFKARCVRVKTDLCSRVRCGRFRRCVVSNRYSRAYIISSTKRYKRLVARRAVEYRRRKAIAARRYAARLKALSKRPRRRSVARRRKYLMRRQKAYLSLLKRLYKRSLDKLRKALIRSKRMTARCVGPRPEKNPCSRVKCRSGSTCVAKATGRGRMTTRCVKMKDLCRSKKCAKGTRCVIRSAVTRDGRKYRQVRRRQSRKYNRARRALRSRYRSTYRSAKSRLRRALKTFRSAMARAKRSRKATAVRALKASWRAQKRRLKKSLRRLSKSYVSRVRKLRVEYKRVVLRTTKTYRKRQLIKKLAKCKADPCSRARCKSGYSCSVVRRYTSGFASYTQKRRLLMQAYFKRVRSFRKAYIKRSRTSRRNRRALYRKYRRKSRKARKVLTIKLKALHKKYRAAFKNRVKEVARCIPKAQKTCRRMRCAKGTRCVVRSVPTWWYKLYRTSVKRAYLKFKSRLRSVISKLRYRRRYRNRRMRRARRVRRTRRTNKASETKQKTKTNKASETKQKTKTNKASETK
uniref:SUEL-type lectin domain-containing protein n=2 Tax=Macrostomum lignano TaxID=282301 RepID=A0A1I8GEL7_9PLAT